MPNVSVEGSKSLLFTQPSIEQFGNFTGLKMSDSLSLSLDIELRVHILYKPSYLIPVQLSVPTYNRYCN